MNINENIPKTTIFSFDEIRTYSIKKIIDNLDSRKVGHLEEFQAITYKVFQIFLLSLYTVWNDEVLKDLKFSSKLKLADIVPAFNIS